MRFDDHDTIAALATPPGRGAVAIVRVSGPAALAIAERMTGARPKPRHAGLTVFRDAAGARIDQGLVLYFPAPGSYTGEDVVELHGHGGAVVSDWLLASACALGARPARAGEFTLRAFLNDKLDLTQAEAVADLIDSGSRRAAHAAARSLEGEFSARVADLQRALTELRVQVEAWLDFVDEDLDRASHARLLDRLESQQDDLRGLLAAAEHGRVLRDGLGVVIAGPPNAGKSSLLNRLAGYDAAIVTATAGTTRDPLCEQLVLGGVPLSVTDTAGLRAGGDPVETEGVRRARERLASADSVLWVSDARRPLAATLTEARAEVADATTLSVVRNKIDLTGDPAGVEAHDGVTVLRVSALTGAGLDALRTHLAGAGARDVEGAGAFSARRRHLEALERAAGSLAAAHGQLGLGALELAAAELTGAQHALGELTGELTSDDLLGEIFATFCVGK